MIWLRKAKDLDPSVRRGLRGSVSWEVKSMRSENEGGCGGGGGDSFILLL